MEKLTDEQKQNLVRHYKHQRPRVISGAKGATGAGFLVNFLGQKKLTIPAVVTGGALGVGDRLLQEETMKKNADAEEINGRPQPFTEGTEQAEVNSYQGLIEQLFSEKARMSTLAQAQLGALFPEGKPESSYGYTLRAGLNAKDASRRISRAFSSR